MSAPAQAVSRQRELLLKAQTESWELRNAKMRGELIPLDDHRRELADVVAVVRAEMLALPGRIARDLGLSKADALRVDQVVRAAMNALAERQS